MKISESLIQWTDYTWNIARGCSKVDEDCKFCYMYRQSLNKSRYNPSIVTRTKGVFRKPKTIKEPSMIFASSLTDWFHEEIDSYRNEAWNIIRDCPQHVFQILTKRPERIIEHLPDYWDEISGRVWLGTSIGSQKSMHRLFDLLKPVHNGVTFLSLEPLHGDIELPLESYVTDGSKVKDLLDWVIVGGESGNEIGKYRYRPCQLEWIERIVIQCKTAGIPVFVKQLGTYLSKQFKMSDRHGGNIDDFPPAVQVRQFP